MLPVKYSLVLKDERDNQNLKTKLWSPKNEDKKINSDQDTELLTAVDTGDKPNHGQTQQCVFARNWSMDRKSWLPIGWRNSVIHQI